MSSTSTRRVELGAGAAFVFGGLDGARPSDAAPTLDLSNLPGARVAFTMAEDRDLASVRALCVVAPSDGWAEGIEEIVLARATQLARDRVVADAIVSFDVDPRRTLGLGFDQRFRASLIRGESTASFALSGRHWLGFLGHDAALCTVVCVEPAASSDCPAIVERSRPEGAWTTAPPPNAFARLLLGAAAQPYEALAVAAALSLALGGVLLARRPRPRPWR